MCHAAVHGVLSTAVESSLSINLRRGITMIQRSVNTTNNALLLTVNTFECPVVYISVIRDMFWMLP